MAQQVENTLTSDSLALRRLTLTEPVRESTLKLAWVQYFEFKNWNISSFTTGFMVIRNQRKQLKLSIELGTGNYRH